MDTGLCASKQAGVWAVDIWVLKNSETLGVGPGDAQAAAPGVCGETEPASCRLPAEESKRLTEEKIYFLMTTSETSPGEACLPASCERFKACL